MSLIGPSVWQFLGQCLGREASCECQERSDQKERRTRKVFFDSDQDLSHFGGHVIDVGLTLGVVFGFGNDFIII
jgi:hypothetical protein